MQFKKVIAATALFSSLSFISSIAHSAPKPVDANRCVLGQLCPLTTDERVSYFSITRDQGENYECVVNSSKDTLTFNIYGGKHFSITTGSGPHSISGQEIIPIKGEFAEGRNDGQIKFLTVTGEGNVTCNIK